MPWKLKAANHPPAGIRHRHLHGKTPGLELGENAGLRSSISVGIRFSALFVTKHCPVYNAHHCQTARQIPVVSATDSRAHNRCTDYGNCHNLQLLKALSPGYLTGSGCVSGTPGRGEPPAALRGGAHGVWGNAEVGLGPIRWQQGSWVSPDEVY
ncbi:uncharacterized protein BO80DRAFT_216896 [Aspergillus ibericus CBS 121593]|uniref:Uncharacterized protein n=1 Tax=Aspergillus ibericus CBS 121593 TaxID=1448316 RepID=A0A395GN73_9EURO|nr:hypothetical protein BO80DRAFT_216896 [Aspergillus ibericus CBS 121593]RAK96834.1 hypothetical protein BO80DRAFT_216896 [Aspergillus ibericus CBS 121593]